MPSARTSPSETGAVASGGNHQNTFVCTHEFCEKTFTRKVSTTFRRPLPPDCHPSNALPIVALQNITIVFNVTSGWNFGLQTRADSNRTTWSATKPIVSLRSHGHSRSTRLTDRLHDYPHMSHMCASLQTTGLTTTARAPQYLQRGLGWRRYNPQYRRSVGPEWQTATQPIQRFCVPSFRE
jgi:hypothetical protein